ncbi:hypothetical protein [Methylocapsa acidiphila]|uniref:hypothetical protein n=1 Tax=Methylocapsa acidiphila TaxID=133552 RepID=UPI0004790AAA|nr:hypothetical protein [Methylocapsa acidiphila]
MSVFETFLELFPVFAPRRGPPVATRALDAASLIVRNFERAADKGLPIPVRGSKNVVWALFTVISDENDDAWAGRRHYLAKGVVCLAHINHRGARELLKIAPDVDLNAISRREIEHLQWSAERKNKIEIGILMPFGPRP